MPEFRLEMPHGVVLVQVVPVGPDVVDDVGSQGFLVYFDASRDAPRTPPCPRPRKCSAEETKVRSSANSSDVFRMLPGPRLTRRRFCGCPWNRPIRRTTPRWACWCWKTWWRTRRTQPGPGGRRRQFPGIRKSRCWAGVQHRGYDAGVSLV